MGCSGAGVRAAGECGIDGKDPEKGLDYRADVGRVGMGRLIVLGARLWAVWEQVNYSRSLGESVNRKWMQINLFL